MTHPALVISQIPDERIEPTLLAKLKALPVHKSTVMERRVPSPGEPDTLYLAVSLSRYMTMVVYDDHVPDDKLAAFCRALSKVVDLATGVLAMPASIRMAREGCEIVDLTHLKSGADLTAGRERTALLCFLHFPHATNEDVLNGILGFRAFQLEGDLGVDTVWPMD